MVESLAQSAISFISRRCRAAAIFAAQAPAVQNELPGAFSRAEATNATGSLIIKAKRAGAAVAGGP